MQPAVAQPGLPMEGPASMLEFSQASPNIAPRAIGSQILEAQAELGLCAR